MAQRQLNIDWAGSTLYLATLLSLMTALAFGGLVWLDDLVGGLAASCWRSCSRRSCCGSSRAPSDPLLDLSLLRRSPVHHGKPDRAAQRRRPVRRPLPARLLSAGSQGRGSGHSRYQLWAPLAIGMLVFSPISGVLSDRWGSRLLATLGMVVTAVGLAGLAFIQTDTPLWQLYIWQAIVGAGAGIFNSPNTSAVMGVVPPIKRGIGAGMRGDADEHRLRYQHRSRDWAADELDEPKVLIAIATGAQSRSAGISTQPFIQALHVAFIAGIVASLLGAVISSMRGEHRSGTNQLRGASHRHLTSRASGTRRTAGVTPRAPNDQRSSAAGRAVGSVVHV